MPLTIYLNHLVDALFWSKKTDFDKHVTRFNKNWKRVKKQIVAELLAMIRVDFELPYRLNGLELYAQEKMHAERRKLKAEMERWIHPS